MRMLLAGNNKDKECSAAGFGDNAAERLADTGQSARVRRILRFLTFLLFPLSLLLMFLPATGYAAQVTLAWNGNSESDLAGYKVYYGTGGGDYTFSLNVGNVTSSTVDSLTEGLTYCFAVTAYNASEPPLESTYSNEVCTDTCTYSISPTSVLFGASGGTGAAQVTTQTGCSWTAISSASWLTITSGSSGLGNGTINYSVVANTGTSSRTASSTFAKNVLTVTQGGTQTYTVTASAGANGVISPAGSVSVSRGANQTFAITPKSGYKISNVTVDGTSVGAVATYTFSNVTANHAISATFTAITYTITASAGTGGSISPLGAVSVTAGASRTFTITPPGDTGLPMYWWTAPR